jgi:hypothetical protein
MKKIFYKFHQRHHNQDWRINLYLISIILLLSLTLLAQLITKKILTRRSPATVGLKQTNQKLTFSPLLFNQYQYQGVIKGVMNTYIGKNNQSAKVKIEKGKNSLEFDLPIKNAAIKTENTGLLTSSSVSIKSPEGNIESRYSLIEKGLKEDIILYKIPSNPTTTFPIKIKLNNLKAEINSSGIPVFYDNKGEYQFHFLRPFAKDAKGNITYAVSYKLQPISNVNNQDKLTTGNQTKTGPSSSTLKQLLGSNRSNTSLPLTNTNPQIDNYLLTIEVDPNWLHDKKRTLPITIDPTVIYDTTTKFDPGGFNRTAYNPSTSTSSVYTIGPNSPGSVVNLSGYTGWSKPENVLVADNNYASFSSSLSGNYLLASNFGFNIPYDARIDGIRVDIKKRLMLTTFIKTSM